MSDFYKYTEAGWSINEAWELVELTWSVEQRK